jgi:hypothetical protein
VISSPVTIFSSLIPYAFYTYSPTRIVKEIQSMSITPFPSYFLRAPSPFVNRANTSSSRQTLPTLPCHHIIPKPTPPSPSQSLPSTSYPSLEPIIFITISSILMSFILRQIPHQFHKVNLSPNLSSLKASSRIPFSRTMASTSAPEKQEWLVILPDQEGALERRLSVRPYVVCF